MEDAVDPSPAAVGVAMVVAPPAGITDVEIINGHSHPARPKPLHEQRWIGIGAEDQLARRIEFPGEDNLRHSGFCGDLCLCRCHTAFLSDAIPCCAVPLTQSKYSVCPRAARRGGRAVVTSLGVVFAGPRGWRCARAAPRSATRRHLKCAEPMSLAGDAARMAATGFDALGHCRRTPSRLCGTGMLLAGAVWRDKRFSDARERISYGSGTAREAGRTG